MQNIMFTSPADEKILNGTKCMTARCWKRKPPSPGDLVTASTGYKKETRFAILRIKQVIKWDGYHYGNAEEAIGLTRQEIAEREGFFNWDDFISAYYDLNASKFEDDNRTNYFIMFKMESNLHHA